MGHRKPRPLPTSQNDVIHHKNKFDLTDSRLDILETGAADLMMKIAQVRSQQFTPFTTRELDAIRCREPRKRVVL